MHWILIVWLAGAPYMGNTGVAVDHIPFQSERACKDAFAAMKEVNAGGRALAGVCVNDLGGN